MQSKQVKVGSRNSQLALIQTNLMMSELKEFYSNNPDRLSKVFQSDSLQESALEFELIAMTTTGDQVMDRSLKDIKATSLFTRELEIALLDGKVDFVVHSLKDLPTTLPEGCSIGAVFKRHDREDTMVLSAGHRGKTNPVDLLMGKEQFAGKEVVIGTSSQRRIAMINRCNPNARCVDIRGNLNTRFRKLDEKEGPYDAIILAKAGLDRMEWTERSSCLLTPNNGMSHWCYAAGQGAIAVECRTNDKAILDLLLPLSDIKTTYEVISERALMKKLEAGCSAPLGVRTTWSTNDEGQDVLCLQGVVLSIDGKELIESSDSIAFGSSDVKGEMGLETTNVILPEETSQQVKTNMVACGSLGISVANKLINLGCMKVMDCARA